MAEVTVKQDGEAFLLRRALRRQAFTGKYQLAYRPIEDWELHMDVYPEGGTGYTGSAFARKYRYTVASDTNTILARHRGWIGRTVELVCLRVSRIWLLYRRRHKKNESQSVHVGKPRARFFLPRAACTGTHRERVIFV